MYCNLKSALALPTAKISFAYVNDCCSGDPPFNVFSRLSAVSRCLLLVATQGTKGYRHQKTLNTNTIKSNKQTKTLCITGEIAANRITNFFIDNYQQSKQKRQFTNIECHNRCDTRITNYYLRSHPCFVRVCELNCKMSRLRRLCKRPLHERNKYSQHVNFPTH